jgi:ribose transport system permease protein
MSQAAAIEPTGTPPSAPSNALARTLAERPVVILSLVLMALVVVTAVVEPDYLSVNGLRNTLLIAAPLAIIAGGQTLVMLTGGIDLSVAMTVTGAAFFAGQYSPEGAAAAIVAGLLVGAVVGLINGIGIGVFRVNALIMTLGMSAILLGLFTAWAQTILSHSGDLHPFIRTLGAGAFLNNLIPYSVVIWAVIAIILIAGLARTGLGRMIYAVGDNKIACRLAGVRVWQVLIAVYVLCGVLAAIAGILLAGRVGSPSPQLGSSLLLPSVAAVVIGGTSIFGGFGGYIGTILGALILGVLDSLLTFLDAGEDVKQVLYGSIILGLAWVYARVTAGR